VQLDLDDRSLGGFNDPAKDELKKATVTFASDLIQEANRIESVRNYNSGNPQITSSMVSDAVMLVRGGLIQPKTKWQIKALRVLAAVLTLIVGNLYDATKLQDSTYMLTFILVTVVAIFAVTAATALE
jgi:hypothetical protein